jgi:hypothetical protein
VSTLKSPKFKEHHSAPRKIGVSTTMSQSKSSGFADPALMRVAQDIYSLYCRLNPDYQRRKQPIGVAIDKLTHRGKLIFSAFPILLPQECFIAIQELEAD